MDFLYKFSMSDLVSILAKNGRRQKGFREAVQLNGILTLAHMLFAAGRTGGFYWRISFTDSMELLDRLALHVNTWGFFPCCFDLISFPGSPAFHSHGDKICTETSASMLHGASLFTPQPPCPLTGRRGPGWSVVCGCVWYVPAWVANAKPFSFLRLKTIFT